MSNNWGCMLLMDWKSDSTALSLVMLRPRIWLLFMRLRKVVTAFCRAFRNCSWFSSDSPFWYCCWKCRARTETYSGSKKNYKIYNAHSNISLYLNYADWLGRDITFNRLANGREGFSQWHRSGCRRRWTLPSLFLFLLPVSSVQVAGKLEKVT